MRLLVVDPSGELILEDSDEKTVGRYPGRSTKSKLREMVKYHTQLELQGIGKSIEIPVSNVSLRNREEIEEILSRIKSGRYQELRDLR